MARKVGIVGAGAVGATAAYTLAMMGTCHEIVLFDIADGVAKGKSIDMAQAAYYSAQGTIITAAEDASDIKDCDIVVITAGVPRKGDMTRADLLMINAKITKQVVQNIKKNSPDAIIICVSNPLDVMTYVTKQITGWDNNRIIGLGFWGNVFLFSAKQNCIELIDFILIKSGSRINKVNKLTFQTFDVRYFLF